MTFEKTFSDAEKVTGYVKKPDLQKQRADKKYFDMRIPLGNVEAMNLKPGELIQIMMRNQSGQTASFKREVNSITGKGLKFYVPRSVVKELDLNEESWVEVFISKD